MTIYFLYTLNKAFLLNTTFWALVEWLGLAWDKILPRMMLLLNAVFNKWVKCCRFQDSWKFGRKRLSFKAMLENVKIFCKSGAIRFESYPRYFWHKSLRFVLFCLKSFELQRNVGLTYNVVVTSNKIKTIFYTIFWLPIYLENGVNLRRFQGLLGYKSSRTKEI